jgi:hypothetical protein
MFSSTDPPLFARPLLGALRLIRSFLLLEDDYVRDWEVDQDEPAEPSTCRMRSSGWSEPDRGDHPHRMALRSGLGARRPGIPVPREQVCLCPLPPVARRSERDRRTVVAPDAHEPPHGAARVR